MQQPIVIGSRVLSVEMNGCMAHREENQVWGKVLHIIRKPVYGSAFVYTVCTIDFGREGKRQVCAETIENCLQGYFNPDEQRGFVWRH